MQRLYPELGQRPHPFQDLFRRRQSGAPGATNDADQLQGLIFRVLFKKAPPLPQVSQADYRSAISLLGAIGAGNNADSGHIGLL